VIADVSRQYNSGEGTVALTAASIADAVGGKLIGDPSIEVGAVAPLDRASKSDLSFLGTAKYSALMATTQAGIVLVSPELAEAPGDVAARVVVAKPQEALLSLLPRFYRAPAVESGINETAVIGRGVSLGKNVSIGAYAVLGDGAAIGDGSVIGPACVLSPSVVVGSNCHLVAQVTLYTGAVLGDRVIVHAGARIASDGFGYVQRGGAHVKIPHVGRCILENDVEIGANTTIDRGSIDDTVVGAGTKIDNLVQVGHNVRIGKLCLIMAQVGIAGSVRVEDGAMLLGQVGVAGHHTIGKGAIIAAQAGVFGDVPPGETWSGYPARPHKQALRAQAALFKVADLIRKIEKLVERSEKPPSS
jgi:UDP-3-O-[3-hydroxymyristoyl] glucosamine N-acyltransferase